jgi:glutathione S-transferase
MLLVEEKCIPVKIIHLLMRNRTKIPVEFLYQNPRRLLPAMECNGILLTDLQIILESLETWFSKQRGYKPMIPDQHDITSQRIYRTLEELEQQ